MNKDLGVWTCEDCALVLIDYQKEMFEVIRSETSADLVELNVRLLAKTAKAFDMPIVLLTVGVEYGFNGPTLPSILSELEGIDPIDRSSMNAFEDGPFREAVEKTGRKRLIIGGLHTEICLTFATVQALENVEVMRASVASFNRGEHELKGIETPVALFAPRIGEPRGSVPGEEPLAIGSRDGADGRRPPLGTREPGGLAQL